MTFFSQARRTCGTTHFIRPCTILHATGFGLPPNFEDWVGIRYTMNMGFNIAWIVGSKYTHGIMTLQPIIYQTPYPWHIEPHIHDISNLLPMLYWILYPCYIEPHTNVISHPFRWYGDQYTMGRGFNIPLVRCSIYYRLGVKILSVVGSIYHWYRV
jgi:hypothetical protein